MSLRDKAKLVKPIVPRNWLDKLDDDTRKDLLLTCQDFIDGELTFSSRNHFAEWAKEQIGLKIRNDTFWDKVHETLRRNNAGEGQGKPEENGSTRKAGRGTSKNH